MAGSNEKSPTSLREKIGLNDEGGGGWRRLGITYDTTIIPRKNRNVKLLHRF